MKEKYHWLDLETAEPVTGDSRKATFYPTDKEEQMTHLPKQLACSKQKVIVLVPAYNELPEMERDDFLPSTKEGQEGNQENGRKHIQLRLEQQKSQHEATIVLYNQLGPHEWSKYGSSIQPAELCPWKGRVQAMLQ